jgi:SAM-dependent methyltransferase
VRDAVRQELVSRQLAAYLPTVTGELRLSVADLGCGQGTQAIRLARLGYEVTGIDLSDELLDLARSAAGEEPDEVRADDPAEVAAALDSAGAERLCWYGVRLFSDHFGPVEVGADLAQLVAAEEQAGCRDPYRQLCALTHTLAVRAPAASQEVDTTPG